MLLWHPKLQLRPFPSPFTMSDSRRSVARHVRERQRAVAEREASRLARPAARSTRTLAHADKRQAAVTSTPVRIPIVDSCLL